jgi:hypothetical protein
VTRTVSAELGREGINCDAQVVYVIGYCDLECEKICINIKLIFTKLRNSFVEFNGTGEDDDEIICMSTNRIYME